MEQRSQHDEAASPAESAVRMPPPETALVTAAGEAGGGAGDAPYEPWRSWRHELPRWLATLNPGRTRVEYERAIRYFFETPGVPEALTDLSFDLLLAYRGALALRAAPRGRSGGRSGFERSGSQRSRLSVASLPLTPKAVPGGSDG